MHRRSIAFGSVFLLLTAAPGHSLQMRGLWQDPEIAGVQCDRALAVAQDIQAGVGKGIVAMVEGVPITDYEMKQRIAWHVALARDVDTFSQARARAHILLELRHEVLDRIAAARAGVIVGGPEVDAEIDEFLSAQGLTRHELQASLERAGVHGNTLRSLVAARLLRARLTHSVPERLQVAPLNCLRMS